MPEVTRSIICRSTDEKSALFNLLVRQRGRVPGTSSCPNGDDHEDELLL